MYYAYVFFIPDIEIVKIGHTSRLKQRLFSLRWGAEARYAPDDRHKGTYACVAGFSTKELAVRCERECQNRHASLRLGTNKPAPDTTRGGKSEWFMCPENRATKCLITVAKRTDREVVIMNYLDLPLLGLT